jgi:phage shock protein E
MGLLDFLGMGTKTESIQDFVAKGALIVDVRSESEFAVGT